jgi:hypothetical protein
MREDDSMHRALQEAVRPVGEEIADVEEDGWEVGGFRDVVVGEDGDGGPFLLVLLVLLLLRVV